MSLDLFIHTPFINLEDRELCYFPNTKLVVYSSDQTHCALQKAAQIASIHPNNVRVIPTTKSTDFALSPHSLRSAIVSELEAGMIPLYLCATVGTTSSTAVDPVSALCDVTKDYDIWVHVDAAYAGSACICPEFRHFINGVEGANSFSLNAHKWFFTNLDCCCLWTKDPTALIKALSTNPEYLKNATTNSKRVVDYCCHDHNAYTNGWHYHQRTIILILSNSSNNLLI